jgi:hypothetical protein
MNEEVPNFERSKTVEVDAEKSVFRFVNPRAGNDEFSATARKLVKRAADATVETAGGLRAKADGFVGAAEHRACAAVTGVGGLGRHIVEASYANLAATAGMVDKLADAASVAEALKIEADYVRDILKQNMEQIAAATSLVSGVYSATIRTARNERAGVADKAA